VAQYEYDGAKRRTVKKSYSGGVLSETRHFFYTKPRYWQVIEERVDAETDPDRQFVWGMRYIDDLVLRDRDTDADGDLDERLFGMQDANWNVTGSIDSAGSVQERYSYLPHGTVIALAADFAYRGASQFEWETALCGYRLDVDTLFSVVRNRILHSSLGQWLQRDPAKLSDGASLYAYVSCNPLRFVDPLGLFCLKSCYDKWIACRAKAWDTYVDCMTLLGEEPGMGDIPFPPFDDYAPNDPANILGIIECEAQRAIAAARCWADYLLCESLGNPLLMALLFSIAVLWSNLLAAVRSGIEWLIRQAIAALTARLATIAALASIPISLLMCVSCCVRYPEACGEEYPVIA
jgi:RHS repeat-associated protein